MYQVSHSLTSTGQEFIRKFRSKNEAESYMKKLSDEQHKKQIYGSIGIEFFRKSDKNMI